MKVAVALLGIGLGLSLGAAGAQATATTTATPDKKPGSEQTDAKPFSTHERDTRPYKTFRLVNESSQGNDGNEILTALRLMLDPRVKLYLTSSQGAITVRATPEELAEAETLIKELDRPKKIYRITFTISDTDSGKRVGVQHFSMVVAAGQRATLKQGSKVPIATGSYDEGKNGTQTQFTYLDIGLSFDATVNPLANGVDLKSLVEQSSIPDEKSMMGVLEPIVRQTKLEGTMQLALNKPLVLGSLDVPGSTRHQDVEVMVELVK